MGASSPRGWAAWDTQLVGTPREGIKSDAGTLLRTLKHPETGDGGLPVGFADHLPGTVRRVEAEGKVG